MEVAAVLFLIFILPILFLIGVFIYGDRWLRGVNKQKYLEKGLKKQLKKGKITESEYEERLNPEVITVPEIILPKRESDTSTSASKVHLDKE